MLGSALVLAFGLVVLGAVRMTGTPVSYGFAVFSGILLVAAACAMHLGAITDTLLRATPEPVQLAARLAGWLGIGAGTAWIISRAPGDEILFSLLTVPAGIGIAGLVIARRRPWPALPFLATAGLLVLLLGPVWITRH